jgi:enoyl-[acyl-carrier protein] reductase III
MVRNLENQWALILGGSAGLGLATAKKMAQEGMNLIVIHRDSRVDMSVVNYEFDKLKAFGQKCIFFNIDATNPDKRAVCIEQIQNELQKERISCVVHSIAKGTLKGMTGENTLTSDDFNITIQAMAISLYDWTKALFDAQLFADNAGIIAFTSEGSSKPIPFYGAVSAAKATLEAIVRQIAVEFAPYGIRCNCIQAGVTDTKSLKMIPNNNKIKAIALKRNPFNRLTKPEDVANVVYLLCQKEAFWINGTTIKVDGGEHLQ